MLCVFAGHLVEQVDRLLHLSCDLGLDVVDSGGKGTGSLPDSDMGP